MGDIVKILDEKQIGKGIYEDEARLEIEERIHFHYKDLRLFFNKEVFLELCALFESAKRKYDQIGRPRQLNHMVSLAEIKLPENDIGTRIGIELQRNDKIHLHYNDLRIHMNLGDLSVWFDVFENAIHNLPDTFLTEVNIDDCNYHEVVNEYIRILKKYEDRKLYVRPIRKNYREIKNRILKIRTNVGNLKERCLGFPSEFPKGTPKALNHYYLCALYEEILENGYAEGTHYNHYLIAYKKSEWTKPYIVNAHRLAVLFVLNYKKIKIHLIEAETNWK